MAGRLGAEPSGRAYHAVGRANGGRANGSRVRWWWAGLIGKWAWPDRCGRVMGMGVELMENRWGGWVKELWAGLKVRGMDKVGWGRGQRAVGGVTGLWAGLRAMGAWPNGFGRGCAVWGRGYGSKWAGLWWGRGLMGGGGAMGGGVARNFGGLWGIMGV